MIVDLDSTNRDTEGTTSIRCHLYLLLKSVFCQMRSRVPNVEPDDETSVIWFLF